METDVVSRSTPYYRLSPPEAVEPERPRRAFGLHVLLVDDDPADVSLITSALKRHPDVASALASDSPAFTLRQLASGQLHPDLILLDIHMPKMDGFGFLENLRKIPSMANTPVVFLTTSRLRNDVKSARHSSALLYMVKPDSFPELQAHLNGVVRRARHASWSE